MIENLVRILGHEIAVAINLESTLHDHAFSTPSRSRESRRVSPPYPRVSFGCGLAVKSRFSPLRQPHRTLGRARIPALAAARVGNCRTRCRETGDWAEEPKDLSAVAPTAVIWPTSVGRHSSTHSGRSLQAITMADYAPFNRLSWRAESGRAGSSLDRRVDAAFECPIKRQQLRNRKGQYLGGDHPSYALHRFSQSHKCLRSSLPR